MSSRQQDSIKLFVIKAVGLSFLFGLIIVLLTFLTGFTVSGSRLQSIAVKEKRLMELQGRRKLVVVGGSSADYGIDCAMIEVKTGIPSTNLAIQASLGISFILSEASRWIEPNDIILLQFEPGLFSEIHPAGEATLLQLVSRYPKAAQYITDISCGTLPMFLGQTIRSNLSASVISLGYRFTGKKTNVDSRDTQGGYIGHQGKNSTYVSAGLDQYDSINPRAISELINFVTYCASINATVYFVFAPVDERAIDEDLLAYYQQQIGEVKDLILLQESGKSLLPASYFFDTSHHLNYERRAEWTEQIISKFRM